MYVFHRQEYADRTTDRTAAPPPQDHFFAIIFGIIFVFGIQIMNKIRLLFFLAAGVAVGCYYDTREELYGISSQTANCDTTGVTYTNADPQKSISAIIAANCSSCHARS